MLLQVKHTIAILCVLITSSILNAQTVEFTFDSTTTSGMMKAAIGPDATSISSNAASNGDCAYSSRTGGSSGIDLEIPSDVFQTSSIYMEWDYTRRENQADFFELGDMRIWMSGGSISISRAVDDGLGGKTVSTFSNIYSMPSGGSSMLLAFSYDETTGITKLIKDGVDVWSDDGQDNRELDWSAADSAAIIGKQMDGSGRPTLCGYRMYASSTPLPVEFMSFEAENNEAAVDLIWVTAMELNNNYFEVQRSVDGENWEPIGYEEGAGNSNQILEYSYTDNNLPLTSGVLYYRIKQVDYDGQFDFSETRSITISSKSLLRIYPNPARRGNDIQVKSDDPSITISVYTISGLMVHQTNSNFFPTTELEAGQYVVQVQYSNRVVETKNVFIY
jgi:hypothetical protein